MGRLLSFPFIMTGFILIFIKVKPFFSGFVFIVGIV